MSAVEALAAGFGPTGFAAVMDADQAVLDALPTAICVCAADGVLQRFNRRAAELWGRTPAIGGSEERFCGAWRLYDLAGKSAGSPTEKALHTGQPQRDQEVVVERPDGTRIAARVNVEVLRDERGVVCGAVTGLEEITHRPGSGKAPIDAVPNAQQVLETLSAAVYATDADGVITFYNRAAVELAGREPELGKDKWCVTWRLRRPDGTVLPHDECPMAVALKEKRPVRGVEAFAERPDGTLVPFMPFPTPMFGPSGELVGAVNMLVDITDQKRTEATLRAQSARLTALSGVERAVQHLAAIVESSGDAIISKGLDTIIQTWNSGAERVFGYKADEVIGKSITILIPEGHESEEPEILSRIRRGERVEHYETQRRRKDGSIIDISLTISPVRDAEGRVVGASKIARDISERKRSEATLARRMREQAALHRFTDRLHRAGGLAEVYQAGLDAIVEALGCERSSILLFDATGVMRFVAWRGLSARYRKAVDGHSPWQRSEVNPQPIMIEDVAEADLPDALKSVVSEEGIGALGFIPMVAGGRLIGKFMTYYGQPHSFDDTETDLALTIARQIGFSVERIRAEDARRLAEEQSRADEKRLQMALDAGRMGAWEWDMISGKVIWSPGLEALHGLEPGTFGGTFEDFKSDIHPDDLAAVEARVEQALRDGQDYHLVYRIRRPDGAERWLEAYGRITTLPDGKPLRLAGVCMDVTERKEGEAQRNLLVAELSHRVKNTLATVISVARQSFTTNPDAQAAQRSFNARIRALGQTHTRLAEANWSGVLLETLLRDELAPYRDEAGANVRLSGPPAMLNPKYALTLGMAVHELATNAAKYGALSVKYGVVEIEWKFVGADLHISWSERGGPPVTAPARNGFGRILIERVLASDLGGKVSVEFPSEGLRCLIVLPPMRVAGEGALFPSSLMQ
jgi:PAS domain S-box-containing protein